MNPQFKAEQYASSQYDVNQYTEPDSVKGTGWTECRDAWLAGYEADRWIPVSEGLPEVKNRWNESDYVLGIESETSYPFTVWYNHDSKIWHVSDHRITIQELNISYWQPLPKTPTL